VADVRVIAAAAAAAARIVAMAVTVVVRLSFTGSSPRVYGHS
jgi:hypothetical protein